MRSPDPPALSSGEVHLWVVRLEAGEVTLAKCRGWLAAEEKARAERFHFDHHARAFVLGRAALRVLVARYLKGRPEGVCFTYGPHGKPALANALSSLRFNVSNSGELAVFAFATGCDIGVDVEKHRAVRDLEAVARRFFSADESTELLALDPAERDTAFFNCWTRKEAYIKAMGGGLSIPLGSFRISLVPGAEPRMIALGGSGEAARAWTIQHFVPAPGYTGALAYRAEPRSVQTSDLLSVDDLIA